LVRHSQAQTSTPKTSKEFQKVKNNRPPLSMEVCQNSQGLTRHDEDVPVLVAVVDPVTGGAVADGEPRRLVADQLTFRIKREL